MDGEPVVGLALGEVDGDFDGESVGCSFQQRVILILVKSLSSKGKKQREKIYKHTDLVGLLDGELVVGLALGEVDGDFDGESVGCSFQQRVTLVLVKSLSQNNGKFLFETHTYRHT